MEFIFIALIALAIAAMSTAFLWWWLRDMRLVVPASLCVMCLAFVITIIQATPRAPAVHIINGFGPGNIYDVYSRVLARHIGQYLPGFPDVIVENVVGGGTIVAGNRVWDSPDSNTLGIISESVGLRQGVDKSIRFDVREFKWVGRIEKMVTIQIASQKSGVRSLSDVLEKPLLIAGYGPGTPAEMVPHLLNAKYGTKFELVTYRSPLEALQAMEAGDVQAMSLSLTTLKKNRPQWVEQGKAVVILQDLQTRHPDLPNVQALGELSTDSDVAALAATGELGIAVMAPPGISGLKLRDYRRAMELAMKDKNFIADMEKADLPFSYASGSALVELVARIVH